MNKFTKFREEYPVFIYSSFDISEKPGFVDISYEFSIPGLADFHPGWSFPNPEGISVKNDPTFRRIAFSLGLAEAVSYWKSVCSPVFRIDCGAVIGKQSDWWKKLWFYGLGEFFYVNGISVSLDDLVEIRSCGDLLDDTPGARSVSGCLVPIGGGKDSALTLETLLNAGMNCRCYAINRRNSISETVNAAGLPPEALVTAQRRFDCSLVKLNEAGFLNGHTPFSSVVAFSAEAQAYLLGAEYIVLSNESSANESTVTGSQVNHQYSKSFEFEQDFHSYEQEYLRTGIYYFSFLRPLAELQIAAMFSKHKKYLPVFRSCNLGSKVSPDIWCGKCPKCLFINLILSPFLSREELVRIFGHDMLNDAEMLPTFRELVGMSEHKPFECVGSINEVRYSAAETIRQLKERNESIPLLLEDFTDLGLYQPESLPEQRELLLRSYNTENLLPERFAVILKNEMERIL